MPDTLTPEPPKRAGQARDPRGTQQGILDAAFIEFTDHGLSGARVDAIAARTGTNVRMIYYYFGSKEGLFIAVLEEMYRRFNEAEAKLSLADVPPLDALVAVIRFMWVHYQKHPEFITLLNTENLHRGKHISKSLRAAEYSSPAVSVLGEVLARGVRQKLFRDDVPARDVYLMIASMGYFYLSNRFTLSAFLGEQLETPEALAHWESFVIDAVMRTVRPATSPAS